MSINFNELKKRLSDKTESERDEIRYFVLSIIELRESAYKSGNTEKLYCDEWKNLDAIMNLIYNIQ